MDLLGLVALFCVFHKLVKEDLRILTAHSKVEIGLIALKDCEKRELAYKEDLKIPGNNRLVPLFSICFVCPQTQPKDLLQAKNRSIAIIIIMVIIVVNSILPIFGIFGGILSVDAHIAN